MVSAVWPQGAADTVMAIARVIAPALAGHWAAIRINRINLRKTIIPRQATHVHLALRRARTHACMHARTWILAHSDGRLMATGYLMESNIDGQVCAVPSYPGPCAVPCTVPPHPVALAKFGVGRLLF